jgi:hypothetical protein
MDKAHITVVRVETTICAPEFNTQEAAKKWIASRKDRAKEGVEYQIWETPNPVPK